MSAPSASACGPLHLAGVAIGFDRGPLRLFQVNVATRQSTDGTALLPPTRADLYTGS
ncbi:MAG: hypothetical protein R3D25_02030 [Geminicoccaceae bacterium]